MKDYKYSVVVPVYNAASTIERCVNSIMKAGSEGVELILIDDCSKDDSYKIIKKMQGNYSNIKVLHNECNKGVSYTRNRGLLTATGVYTLFVDSDDWIDESYFDVLDKVIDKYPREFVIWGFVNHDEVNNGRMDKYQWRDFVGTKRSLLKEQMELLYEQTLLQQLWNKIFLTDVIQSNHIQFDESISIGEDFRFVLQYLKVSQQKYAVLLNETLYHYMRDQAGSLMYRVGYESVEEPLKNLRIMYELMEWSEDEIHRIIEKKKNGLIDLYAYLIMHNVGMRDSEKKRLIRNLDEVNGSVLYRKNRRIFFKERCVIWLKKIGINIRR